MYLIIMMQVFAANMETPESRGCDTQRSPAEMTDMQNRLKALEQNKLPPVQGKPEETTKKTEEESDLVTTIKKRLFG